jgi:hypothetical protein
MHKRDCHINQEALTKMMPVICQASLPDMYMWLCLSLEAASTSMASLMPKSTAWSALSAAAAVCIHQTPWAPLQLA